MVQATAAGDDTPSAPRGRTVAGVLDTLRDMILHRELLPGAPIRQEEMARVLGISRVPLREVLRVLTTEGLLTHRPHQGYVVTRLSAEHLEQIHTLLEFLETELIRSVRWPTDAEIDELRAVNAEIAAAAHEDDIAAVNQLNRELHARIFRLSSLTIYLSEAERFWTLSEPYRLLHVATTDAAVATEQHDQLIDALAARDRALCLRGWPSTAARPRPRRSGCSVTRPTGLAPSGGVGATRPTARSAGSTRNRPMYSAHQLGRDPALPSSTRPPSPPSRPTHTATTCSSSPTS